MPDGFETGKRRPRKEQLERLIRLAQNYRGWNQKQIAKALERDPHNLVPDGGIPRLDLVLRLAETLDWPIASVVDDLCGSPSMDSAQVAPDGDCASLMKRAWLAIREGQHAEGTRLALAARVASRDNESRAYTYLLEYWTCELQGRYEESIATAQAGLRISRHDSSTGRWLRGYLANSHYLMGSVHEAIGIATHLLEELGRIPLENADRSLQALALSLRGQCRRTLATQWSPPNLIEAQDAVRDLAHASMLFKDQASRRAVETDVVGAMICDGALLEVKVVLGHLPASEAVAKIIETLDCGPPDPTVSKEWPIAIGWWCIYGCNIVLRHLTELHDSDRSMAILTNKADECATATGNWALRERVWTIEHYRRRELEGANATGEKWVLDREEIATLTGAMGRFPGFRQLAWSVLSGVDLEESEGA